MDAFEELRLNRLTRMNNIEKGMNTGVNENDILKAFGGDDCFEKGKWSVGDEKVYQGITYFVSGFNAKGLPLWRMKKDGGGNKPASTAGGKAAASEKKSDDIDVEYTLNQQEYDRITAQAKKVDRFSREYALSSTAHNLKDAVDELNDVKKKRPGAKKTIEKLQERVDKMASQFKAMKDYEAHIKAHPEERDFDAELRSLKEFRDMAKEHRDKAFDRYITKDAIAKRTGDDSDKQIAEVAETQWKFQDKIYNQYQTEIVYLVGLRDKNK